MVPSPCGVAVAEPEPVAVPDQPTVIASPSTVGAVTETLTDPAASSMILFTTTLTAKLSSYTLMTPEEPW